MTESQNTVLDTPSTELQQAVDRAERAEAKLAELQTSEQPASNPNDACQPANSTGIEALRNDAMMAHLLDSLQEAKDIGHYGRLVFAMVARHFLSDDEVLAHLTQDPDFSPEQARLMLRQVEGKDYNPPRRDRILQWQTQQEFPILPHPDDPDCGNLYRTLTFPESVYEHIGHYQEHKADASS